MRPFQEVCERWDATFAENQSISDLRAAVKNEGDQSPCTKGLRSICWKSFLLFENLDKSTWNRTLSDSRSAYGALRDHFLKDIKHPDDISEADPLTSDDTSPWSVLRQDEALRAEIFQDVERCMPENHYFREPSTQAMLLDILFIHCKLNRDVGYRQGMHEVLAPMLWVVSCDAIDGDRSTSPVEDDLPKYASIRDYFDSQYVEHDTFTLFGIIMRTVKSFYEMGTTSTVSPSSASSNSPIIERSRRIHEVYLRQADPELADHLTAIEILPQIFLIRWIRLMFGREFPLDHVLVVWDVLFAEDPTLDLIDLVCVSMLLRIRWQLLRSDYSEALTLLLRYPVPSPPNGPSTFVADAVHLRQNIMHSGGMQIIEKYTGAISDKEKSHRVSKSQQRKHAKQGDQSKISQSLSPGRAASRFLQEQGGIDSIIQEAAKGVYSRGEKWGVNKALRGAVEGLQSSTSLPRRQLDGPRWSLDDGSHVPSDENRATEIKALEQRSKGLARLLEKAIGELWEQQRQCSNDKEEAIADALSLAIAKVQFVQVYLENPTMPFVSESSEMKSVDAEEQEASATKDALTAERRPADSGSLNVEATSHRDLDRTPREEESSIDAVPNMAVAKSRPKPSSQPFHYPRPSLAQSSFSWMLGEDQRKSSFVSASPFPSEKRAAKDKADHLFGEGKADTQGKRVEKSEEDEVINLGTLKVRK